MTTGMIRTATSSRRPRALVMSLVPVLSPFPRKVVVPPVRVISVLLNARAVVSPMVQSPDA